MMTVARFLLAIGTLTEGYKPLIVHWQTRRIRLRRMIVIIVASAA